MRALAETGIDVLCTNDEGFNALHIACFKNDFYIVKMLLESDYPMELECKNGMTALQIATHRGCADILEIMIYFAFKKNKKYLKKIMDRINP